MIRYEWYENVNTDLQASLHRDFLTNTLRDTEEVQMARTRRFVRDFNQHGNDYAKEHFMYGVSFSDVFNYPHLTRGMSGQEIEDEND